ncbi:MAG: hypothetical protein WCF23_16335 [Candidatus Nitrosopolaris sp.]
MNRTALAIAPIVAVAALALTAVTFAIPQQASAWGDHQHQHHNHNNDNRIDVSQTINQENDCSFAECVNDAQNQADIHR